MGTSTNGDVAGWVKAGLPANRYKNAAIASRRTGAAGWNSTDPSGCTDPVEIPWSYNHWM